jgi:deazaflavin-dependent oxidoreductase (nitroreductase family)
MTTQQDYLPSPTAWVRNAVEKIESSGSTEPAGFDGRKVVLMTMRGASTGKLRKVPVMRVEHDGRYAAVASHSGGPKNPVWYYNLRADPRVRLQDDTVVHDLIARELAGEERDVWWERSVAAFPTYADYEIKTDRLIPVFLLEPAAR